jgi:transketolase
MRTVGRKFAGSINQAMRKQKDATNRINRAWARSMRNFARQYVKDSFKFSLRLAEKDEAELKSQVDQATWDHYLANREAMIDAIVPSNDDITDFVV